MQILFFGDIVAKPGRQAVTQLLPKILQQHKIDIVIANAENLAHGRGVTLETLQEMQEAGVNYFTGGDHIFWQRDFEDVIEMYPVLRPANYPIGTPGFGHALIDTKAGEKLLLINVMCRTFLNERLDDPFTKVDEILEQYDDNAYSSCIVDFHAEATSEKHALAFYLDGRVDAVIGTHTHVPTCDNRTLPKGTMYITDAGMTGNVDSVLGVDENIIIAQYLTGRNQRFEWKTTGNIALRSVIIDTDNRSIVRCDEDI